MCLASQTQALPKPRVGLFQRFGWAKRVHCAPARKTVGSAFEVTAAISTASPMIAELQVRLTIMGPRRMSAVVYSFRLAYSFGRLLAKVLKAESKASNSLTSLPPEDLA